MLKISAVYLIENPEIPIHYTSLSQVEQALLNCEKKIDGSNFDKVQKFSKFGPMDMPLGSTFEIGTQIIFTDRNSLDTFDI